MSLYPLISIVIPCYNSELYIKSAINSALKQTYKNIEVIVIDDGSGDKSLEKIKSFGNRIISKSIHHSGAQVSRNLGLMLAKGKYIQFLDADDILMPEKVEKCFKAFSHDVDVVYCKMKVFYESHYSSHIARRIYRLIGYLSNFPLHLLFPTLKAGSRHDLVKYLLAKGIQTSSPLHRTAIVKEIGGFRTDLRFAQEYELHIRMALAGCVFKPLHEKLTLIRQHGSIYRISNSKNCSRQRAYAHAIVEKQLKRAGHFYGLVKSLIYRKHVDIARSFLREHKTEESSKYLRKANALFLKLNTYNLIFDFFSLFFGAKAACRLKLYIRSFLNLDKL